jgi:peptide/nickel transport system permease protein
VPELSDFTGGSVPSSRLRSRALSPRAWVTAVLRNKVTTLAVVFLALVVVGALLSGHLAITSNARLDVPGRNLPPFSHHRGFHLLGTDPLGRDVLGQLMNGAKVSIIVSVAGVLVSGTVGTVLGLLAGYYGGRFDQVVMRLVDLQMSLPSLLIALLVLYILGPSLVNVVLVLSITRWMVYTRVTRGLVLSLKHVLFVEAARSLGARSARIIFRHMLPNVWSQIVVLATLELALMLLTEASLDFLGLGIQPPDTSWGLMLSNGQQYLITAWWLVAFPGLAIMLTSLCINLVATSLRSRTGDVATASAGEDATPGLQVAVGGRS